jgi:hypothetical protein
VTLGGSRTSTPWADSTRSFAVSAEAALSPRSTLSGSYTVLSGERARAVIPSTQDLTAPVDDRERSLTASVGLAQSIEDPEEAGDAGRPTVRVRAGLDYGVQAVPIWVALERLSPDARQRIGVYKIGDVAPSMGLSAGWRQFRADVGYKLHHYGYPATPAEVDPRTIAWILSVVRTSVSGVVPGLPHYETTCSVSQGLSRVLTATVSYAYTRISNAGDLSRTFGVDLAWQALEWLELRAGGSHVAQAEPASYGTMGLSVWF